MRGRERRVTVAGVLVLALLGTALVRDHQRLDSATMDEPFHALASAEYAISGTYYANLEHPPLAKLLAGASLALSGARAPRLPKPFSFATAEMPAPFCYANAIPADALFDAARGPFPLLFLALVAAAGLWAASRAGAVAGLGAAALLAFEPTLVAHAGFLHTDLPASLGFLGSTLLLLSALERRSLARFALAGLVLGLTLATKFSAVFLAPVLLLFGLLHALRVRPGGPLSPPSRRPLAGLALFLAVAAAALLSTYAVCLRSMGRPEAEQSVRQFLASRHVTGAGQDRVAAVSRAFPPLGHYVAGLAGVAAQNRFGGGVNVLRGKLSVEGFPGYFPVALSVKTSLGLLALLVAGLLLLLLRRAPFDLVLLALLLPAAQLLLSGLGASYNIGVRHMLPALVLLALAAVLVVVRALPPRGAAALLALCAAVQAYETLAVHPHEVSFFNALAGGPSNGEAWLNDSNLDWGQDLRRLPPLLTRLGIPEEDVTVAYFGGALPSYHLPRSRTFDPARDAVGPGVWAVSSYVVTAAPELMRLRGKEAEAEGYERLRQAVRAAGPPFARVGYSIALYRLKTGGPARP